MAKESPKAQEMGPKKYKKMVEDSHKFYDKYKAGRTDPKTGVYYNEISLTKPKSKSVSGCIIKEFQCFSKDCGNYMTVRRNTAGICCSKCNKYHSVNVDKLTEEVKVNGVKINEFGQRSESESDSE